MAENVPLTPEEIQIAKDRYRFSGLRYSIRGPDACGSDEIIPQESGLYAFPKSDIDEGILNRDDE